MRRQYALILACLLASLVSCGLRPALAAGLAADYGIAGGHFYSEANGQGGAGGSGYAVTNDGGIPFWSTFGQAGGVGALGYPASQRYGDGGFTEQIFQKTVLQWNGVTVAYLNVLDVLHSAGKDAWLQAAWLTPPPAPTDADSGLPWPAVVARHQAMLDSSPALRAAYFAVPDPLSRYGLPVSSVSAEGPALVVRCQRAVLQLWLRQEPWAAAGAVTVANAGDILKASGLVTPPALVPAAVPAGGATSFTYVALGASDAAGYGASAPTNDYVALLGTKLAGRYESAQTVDLGIDGATTATVADQEAPRLAALHPNLVTITIGPNDIISLVPPNQFNADLNRLLNTVQASHPEVIALATMPDFSLAPAVPPFLRATAHALILAYNTIITAQARLHSTLLVDLYSPSEQLLPGNSSLVTSDGFHPNDAGYALYASAFWQALQRVLP
ncbi:MAG TPA: SGNH/GDSL hydrolase family protein [Chloroflexota bacterium]|nr:SGNH/GDSL hydrolase family protein [Chloroflexota bacterium]